MVESEIQGRGVGKKTSGCVSVKETRVNLRGLIGKMCHHTSQEKR